MRLHFSAGTVFATASNSSKFIFSSVDILRVDELGTANFDFCLRNYIVDILLMSAIVYLYKKVANEKLKFVVYILQFVNQLDVLPHAVEF